MPRAQCSSTCSGQNRRLWVFDFDWTVVDDNSDTWIHRCAPGQALPPSVRDSYVPPDWVGYMNRVLGYLAEQGVTPDDLQAQLETIPWTPGMRMLLEAIRDSPAATAAASRADLAANAATVATPLDGPAPSHDNDGDSSNEGAASACTVTTVSTCPATSPTLTQPSQASSTDGGSAAGPKQGASPSEDGRQRCATAAGRVSADAAGPVEAITPRAPCSPHRGAEATAAAPLPWANEAIILSDANSFFIPWILDGGRGGSGGQKAGPYDATDTTNAANTGCATCSSGKPGARAGSALASSSGTSSDGTGSLSLPRDRQTLQPLSHMFLAVLTNPAAVDPASGAVTVSPHHGPSPRSAAPPHACRTCHPNLCKRTALTHFLDERVRHHGVSYEQIVYVGDGRNDLCPCLALGRGDVVMPRVGFALHKLLLPMVEAAGAAAGKDGEAAGGGGGAAEEAGRGDDHVYGAATGAAAATAAVAGQHTQQSEGTESRQVLHAACVPWSSAYDILDWVRRQDEQEALVAKAAGVSL